MEQIISKELLINSGFEDITNDWEKQYHKEHEGIEDYVSLRRWTDDVDKNSGKTLKLDIDNGLSNSGRIWYIHVDNCDCCSIGSAEINTVEQFNKLMEIFESKYKLKTND